MNMKTLYITHEITVEKLTKRDVLCSSGNTNINPNVFNNHSFSGKESGSQGLGGLSNVI